MCAGPVFWDVADGQAVMTAYREFLPTAPERLGAFVGLKTVPMIDPFPAEHQGKPACAVISCFNGTAVDGVAAIAPLRDKLPEPLFDWTGEMPYPTYRGCSTRCSARPAVVLAGRLRR